jgi:hypothetical protein
VKCLHNTGEEHPTYADSKYLVGEENPPQCANGAGSRSSQSSQMPSKVCCKQNTHRAKHLVAENDLGVRKVGMTYRKTHKRHRCCNVPEVQEPIRISNGYHKEQNTCNSVESSCLHRNFSSRRMGRSRAQRVHKEVAGVVRPFCLHDMHHGSAVRSLTDVSSDAILGFGVVFVKKRR